LTIALPWLGLRDTRPFLSGRTARRAKRRPPGRRRDPPVVPVNKQTSPSRKQDHYLPGAGLPIFPFALTNGAGLDPSARRGSLTATFPRRRYTLTRRCSPGGQVRDCFSTLPPLNAVGDAKGCGAFTRRGREPRCTLWEGGVSRLGRRRGGTRLPHPPRKWGGARILLALPHALNAACP